MTGTAYAPRLVACGEIRLSERHSLAHRLSRLYAEMVALIDAHAPSESAVEAPFHGASARAGLQLAHARGVVLAALGASEIPVFEYSPATIKKAVTGNGRAEKSQVEAMVACLVRGGIPRGKPDMADAIAAALCHLFGVAPAERLRAAAASDKRR